MRSGPYKSDDGKSMTQKLSGLSGSPLSLVLSSWYHSVNFPLQSAPGLTKLLRPNRLRQRRVFPSTTTSQKCESVPRWARI